MKTRLEEVESLLIDANCKADEAILNHASRDEIWRLIELRTRLIIEKHDLTCGDNHYEHEIAKL